MITYFNGEFLPKEAVQVSPDDRGFLFADGAYEVIRAYEGKLFRLTAHLQRLQNSLHELRITAPDAKELQDVAVQLIEYNDLAGGDAALYIQVTRGVAPRTHAFPPGDTPPTVYAAAWPFHAAPERLEHGVRVILVPDIRWSRCDIKSVALLPNVLVSQQARENDAYEAIFVRDGIVTEGSHANCAAVFDGQLVTHPKSNHILPGVTRQVVLELCEELDLPYRESPISEVELPGADELMLLGTTTEVMPVVQVDDWPVADGQPGPITKTLQQAFQQVVAGE